MTPERKYRAEAEKQIAEAGCRTRSDSVRVVEALISATPEFFKGKKRAKVKEFFMKRWNLSNSIKPRKRLFLPWCIWMRKLPICTFVVCLAAHVANG